MRLANEVSDWLDDEVDREERDVEFSQMADSLSVDEARRYAAQVHAHHTRLDDTPLMFHLDAVSRASARLTKDFFKYSNASVHETRYWCRAAEVAGILHETQLRSGVSFESLSSRGGPADEAIARAVASLTPDVRVPRPKRNELLANSLGLGGVMAQIVKLVDLRHDASFYTRLVEEQYPAILEPVVDYCLETRFVLDSFHNLEGHPWSRRVLGEIRSDLHILQDWSKCPKRRVKKRN